MKFTCAQTDLHTSIQTVSRIVSFRSTLPILNNILIETRDASVIFTATNLEMAALVEIPATIHSGGSITVPAKILAQYTSLLPHEEITISDTEDGGMFITSSQAKTKIKGLRADEYPSLPALPNGELYTLPSDVLFEAITQTAVAAASDETHPILASVLLSFLPSALKIVATDSYRLVEYTIPIQNEREQKIIVPIRAITELSRIIDKSTGTVQITVTQNQIQFQYENKKLISRLIEGRYPPYEQIIPHEWKTRATIDTDTLLNTLRRVGIFSQEGSRSVKLQFSTPNTLSVTALSEQIGSEEATLTTQIEGEPQEIAFNVGYLLDALSRVTTPTVTIEITGSSQPGVIRADTEPYLHVVMPLKL